MNRDDPLLSRLRVLRAREESVLLDSDLAGLYGVETKAFNQALRRNAHRFPRDFAFQLTAEEFVGLRSQIVTSNARGGRRYIPWVFTEHGAIMAATILNSERATAMSTYVVRAFVRLRRELLTNATLETRLTKIEKDLLSHDAALRSLYTKIKPLLLSPPETPAKEMGFHTHRDGRSLLRIVAAMIARARENPTGGISDAGPSWPALRLQFRPFRSGGKGRHALIGGEW